MSVFVDFPRISPFLWFNANAEEAVDFYVSLFPNSSRTGIFRTPTADGSPGPALTVSFQLDGLHITALNGGPGHPLTDAFSLVVQCADQSEIDRYWDALTADSGSPIACGWCRDRFGMHWQFVPKGLINYIRDPRGFQAMVQMIKMDIPAFQRALSS
jgi:predicted 3-demethylubiquinone-9 3-methyltransferase (glyoxalase superfamily)